ncbi:HAMP domain-containing sensor histidine kinase [Geoalkalibacter halelectricus]|uniref:HAMP domain-containing sensor histidine kinase n=1 Tax=Geoalkalibacter halelectricus TaxID=2847045 RepID=UPI003D1B12B1
MSLLRPKSFQVFIVIGFGAVLMPLLITLIAAEVSVSRLVDKGTEAVYRSVAATDGGRIMLEHLVDLERKSRQYRVLKDPQILEEVAEKYHEFFDSLNHLRGLSPPDAQQVLDQLLLEVGILITALQRTGGPAPDLDTFAALNELAKAVYFNSYELIKQEVGAMQSHADRTQMVLLWTSLALVLLTLALVGLFTRLLARPVKQINRGISRMGAGDYDQPIRVGGPQDLQFLGERLNWLRRRLGEVEREKTKFLAHVSHELKTPLASIREGSELMMEEMAGPLNTQQREIVHILQKNSLQLQKLIENLLGFSRGQALGEAETAVDVLALVEDILEDQRAAVLKKELKMRTSLSPLQLQGDRDRLRILMDNLLSNAVKFTPVGGVVELSVGRDGDMALIEVGDSGPGIQIEESEKIFQPFYQGSAPCLSHVQGTGLGLSIVREYVDSLSGRVDVGQSPAGGALFRVWLPLAAEDLA